MTSISKEYPAHDYLATLSGSRFEDAVAEFDSLLAQYQTLLSGMQEIYNNASDCPASEGLRGDSWIAAKSKEIAVSILRSAITTSKEGSHE